MKELPSFRIDEVESLKETIYQINRQLGLLRIVLEDIQKRISQLEDKNG